MATQTDKYKLKKPDPSDFYDIADFNDNADKIDTALKNHDTKLAETVLVSKGGTGATSAADARTNLGVAPISHASTATTYGRATSSNYGHAMASSANPVVAGTANVGTDNGKYAREGHVHAAQTTVSGNAGTATALQTSRTIAISGGATGTATSFNGSSNITIPVTGLNMGNANAGTLPIARGGTGGTTIASARNALGLGNATGAIPIANGGTGQTSIAAARNAFGLGNTTGAVPVANGGTGASNAADARNNLRMKRTLWDGKWSTGSITVNELSDYRIFALTIEGFATRLLVFNTGSNFRGEGGYALSDGQIETMFFNATVNGNVLTYVAGTYTRMAATGNSFTRYGAKSLVVTNIQGLL